MDVLNVMRQVELIYTITFQEFKEWFDERDMFTKQIFVFPMRVLLHCRSVRVRMAYILQINTKFQKLQAGVRAQVLKYRGSPF